MQRRSAARIASTNDYGVAIEAREAACMAVLGALCQDGVGITIPGVTGCATPAPLAGTWVHPPGRPYSAGGSASGPSRESCCSVPGAQTRTAGERGSRSGAS